MVGHQTFDSYSGQTIGHQTRQKALVLWHYSFKMHDRGTVSVRKWFWIFYILHSRLKSRFITSKVFFLLFCCFLISKGKQTNFNVNCLNKKYLSVIYLWSHQTVLRQRQQSRKLRTIFLQNIWFLLSCCQYKSRAYSMPCKR